MKAIQRVLITASVALLMLWVAAYARQLGAREAREKIAEALQLDSPNSVRVKDISSGPGGQAVVEATVEAAFRFVQEKDGKWRAVDLRTGDRQWQSFELIHTAIRKEKILRTTAEMRTLATALESFRRERGFYVVADTNSALVDNLAPDYLNPIIRIDAWSREFQYKGTTNSYRLASLGPDQKPNTGDEIVIENGQLVQGATE